MDLSTIESTLRERQTTLKQAYRDNPESARQLTVATSATVPGGDPRRVRIGFDRPEGLEIEAGAHPSVGGVDDLPCSGDILLASLAACQEVTIRLVASALGIELTRLAVRAEGDWDARGTLGVSKESPIGFTDLRVLIDLETEGAPDRIERLLQSTERYCVIGQTLESPPKVVTAANVTNRAGAAAPVD